MTQETTSITIEGHHVGPDAPIFVVAEIGQAHDGSLGMAHAYIDAVAKTGVQAIKFQTHIAHAESTRHEQFRVRVFPQDATRYDYWKRMEFTSEQWAGLVQHAHDKGLVFLSTPFSNEAVDLLEKLGMPAWKIGSGETGNFNLLERVASTGRPVLLSSGMSSWSELDDAVSLVKRHGAPLAIFQCTTSYPCPPELVGLNVIGEIAGRYRCPAGLSDHSGTIFAGLGAAAVGASLIEVHTVFSKESFGPDVPASLTTQELAQLAEGLRFLKAAFDSPVRKDEEARARGELKQLFGKSVVAARDLTAGTTLKLQDLAIKKPGTGIPANRRGELIGRVIRRDYAADDFIVETELD